MLYQGPGGIWFVEKTSEGFQVREFVPATGKSLLLGGYADLSEGAAHRLAQRMSQRVFDARIPGWFVYPNI